MAKGLGKPERIPRIAVKGIRLFNLDKRKLSYEPNKVNVSDGNWDQGPENWCRWFWRAREDSEQTRTKM